MRHSKDSIAFLSKFHIGPDPYTALCLIDHLGLYNTIFTDPKFSNSSGAKTERWANAYRAFRSSLTNDSDEHLSVRNILLMDKEDEYLAWILVALVPWANKSEPVAPGAKSSSRSSAERVTRESLKRGNTICKVVGDAASNLTDIIEMKNASLDELMVGNVPKKRKHASLDRGKLGMKIRQWGPHWRSCVIFTLALELMESEDHQGVFKEYAAWLNALRDLDVLNAYELKHVIDGRRVKELCNLEGGPWIKEALDVVMEWQLQNPGDPHIENCEVRVKEWWGERRTYTKT